MLTTDTLVSSEASFMSSTHLIMGDQDAVLVDALLAKSDALQAVDWIRGHDRRLTHIYITHAHPDHFLGLPVILEAFPEARAVAFRDTAEDIAKVAPTYHAADKPVYGDNLADSWAVPEALPGHTLTLEGEELRVIEVGPGEADRSTALHVPSIRAIAAADQIFSHVHVWLVEYRPEGSLAGVETIRSAGPLEIVLPGHGPAGGSDLLDANERYIRDFMSAAQQPSKEAAVAEMMEKYGDFGMPVILDFGMQAAVEGKSYPQIMADFMAGQ
ncbi:MBL fold metallo-hydrolase [Agromyces sp. SYSU K20354]|uniref:MBL fold metallo-hydrolase n=1 Tax=Agromyces cavernae TaxID=2898659 RepID=UPI001E5F0A9E|nr:MBL fold metallo-hydrolase [Agromyces cavernae]MCD2442166.1 MBL fold metallo-hydrolase [Agromyces cavernae]